MATLTLEMSHYEIISEFGLKYGGGNFLSDELTAGNQFHREFQI